MTTYERVTCGELTVAREAALVDLRGWVNSSRDHGGLIFVDVRDRYGITQCVFDPRADAGAAELAGSLRSEDVIAVRGTVRRRPAGTENAKLATGEIEIAASALEVLNRSQVPPFPIHGDVDVDEALRLKFRYLDLRRPRLQHNVALRHRAIKAARDYLDAQGFLEIETPMLIKRTPEGARDFLVPSRIHPGAFYALPQSPQLFKQLLMIAGFDRYFQIARCFRDEDSRADRQPEFTQIDIEMSFVSQDDVLRVTEGLYARMFGETLGVELAVPFRRMSYADAVAAYGTDKPDLRFGMELRDFAPAFAGTEFKIFAQALESRKSIVGFVEPQGARRSRRDFDALTAAATDMGAKGLAWLALGSEIKTSLPKSALTERALADIRRIGGAGDGDAVYFVSDDRAAALDMAGKMRLHIADQDQLRDPKRFAPCWVVDFPLFERDPATGAIGPMHHPFTAPAANEKLEGDILNVQSQHYDLVVNGWELGSGSIRIHDPAVQMRVFKILGYTEDEVRERFGFLLEALEFGAPPHGGIAPGVDRTVALMAGEDAIREVIAFPKNQRFADLMIDAPSPIDPELLRELHIRITAPQAKG